MPPFSSFPTCTTHRPSTTMGEHEAKNRGGFSADSVLRQRTLPLAASRHERVCCTPSVRTFPSTTVGELRGPGKRAAGPPGAFAAYLSDQDSFPVVASRHEITSSLSWRAKT